MFFQIVLQVFFREQRHFHVEIAQRRLRNVQKSVMHVPSCCFANLLFFCRSRCRRRRRCLSSLISNSVLQHNTRKIYFEEYVRLDVGLPSSIFSGGGTGDESSSCFLAHPPPKFACRPLMTSLICITNLVKHQGHATSYVYQRPQETMLMFLLMKENHA